MKNILPDMLDNIGDYSLSALKAVLEFDRRRSMPINVTNAGGRLLRLDLSGTGLTEEERTLTGNRRIRIQLKNGSMVCSNLKVCCDAKGRPLGHLRGRLLSAPVPVSEYCYQSDNNKNITSLTDDAGAVCAAWEYDAYGNIINQIGEKLDVNPLRFSSEYHDEELGLVYYNYRHYNPKEGRWISRDPIEEEGGDNVYCFLKNTNNNKDYLGLWRICREGNYLASAVPDSKYDTWKGLADALHLSPNEVSEWVTGYTSKVDSTKWYGVPNTIIQAWYGDVGWIGRRYAGWDLEPSGDYKIIQMFYPSSPRNSFKNEVGTKAIFYSSYKALYGVYIHGHGNKIGVSWGRRGEYLGERLSAGGVKIPVYCNPIIWTYNTNLFYKLARVSFRVCESRSAEKYCAKNGGVCDVFDGTYCPMPIGWGF